jgi:ADP-heptose:LPS heptosyltransferase
VRLAAPPALAPLAALVGCDLVPTAPLRPLPAAAHAPDLLVNLHGRGPQSHRVALAARPRRLVAFAHADVAETAAMPAWRAGEHEVQRWCRLLAESGIPADPSDLGLSTPPLTARLALARGATVVHPGAASEARRWPVERFAAVAREVERDGGPVAVTGGRDERALAHALVRRADLPAERVLAGATDLLELVAVIGHAACVVCGDTGVAHLATALGTPSVLLFGPTSPREWGPPPSSRHRVLWAGRTGDPHGAEPDPGLLELGPRDVVAALHALPERVAA